MIEEDQDLLKIEKEEKAHLNQAEVQVAEAVKVVNLIKKASSKSSRSSKSNESSNSN